jgi:hypothetical protein
VGDLGQKIYQREHDLKRIGILKKDVELPKSFKMYRTPMYISMLATQFIYKDLYTRREFENSGYKGNFDFQNKLDNAAVILKSLNPEKDIADKIESLKKGGILDEDIMIITSSEKIKKLEDVMMNAGIPVSRGETEEGGSLVIVDFMNVKGLEKDVVIVYGIEDLYHSSKDEGIFDSEDEKNIKERLSRKLIYIALTRTIEQLYIYYTDSLNPYISQLISINKNIEDKRQAGEK